MTNKNKKPRDVSGYRAPASLAEPSRAPRRGLLDQFLGGSRSPAAASMPKLRTSLARGILLAASTPVLIVGLPFLLLAEWVVLIALGFQGPFTLLNGSLALPPVGTLIDLIASGTVFTGGGPLSFAAILVVLLLRAALLALVATVAVERLRTGEVTWWSARRALRVIPSTLAVGVVSLTVLIVGNVGSAMLGAGFGLLAFFGAMVFGLYFTAFVPAIAADEDRSMPETLRRAFSAARMPGAGNLTLAALYILPAWALFLAPLPGSALGLSPEPVAWAVTTLINIVYVGVSAMMVFRYLSIAPFVAEPAPRSRTR